MTDFDSRALGIKTKPHLQLRHARFTILAQGLIRMEWSETKTFEDRPPDT
jgi:hypothetical protein